jgi:hypothetical protein
MQYALSVRKDNIEAYLDIEKSIKEKQNGLLTFIIRVNNGKIVDYNQLEFVDARTKYLQLKKLIITELTILSNSDGGTKDNALRTDDD